jgi:hypothetical protein
MVGYQRCIHGERGKGYNEFLRRVLAVWRESAIVEAASRRFLETRHRGNQQMLMAHFS